MTIEHPKVVDIIGIDEVKNEAVLTIVDHLDWDTNEHAALLQEKINTYLAFIEGGEMANEYPQANGREIVIEVLGSSPLNEHGQQFYDSASVILSGAGFKLRFSLLKEAA